MTSRTLNVSLRPESAAGVNGSKIFAPEALHLEQRDGECISERQCHGGAGRRSEVVGTSLFGDRAIEGDRRNPGERGIRAPR